MQHVPITITSIPSSGCCLCAIIFIYFVMCQLSNDVVLKPTFLPHLSPILQYGHTIQVFWYVYAV